MRKNRKSDNEVFREVLIEEARERPGEHSDDGSLVDYLAGTLAPERDDRFRDHLVACPECASKVLDMDVLMSPDAPAPAGVVDLERESAWRLLESRIMSSAGLPAAPARAPVRWAPALAASLLVATLGLSGWVAQLQQSRADLRSQVAELTETRVNPPIEYLDGVTRSEPETVRIEFARSQPFVLLIAIPSTPEQFSSFEAVLEDRSGTALWSGGDLELSEAGTLRLQLSRDRLPEGEYVVRIEGLRADAAGGTAETVIEQRLQVAHRPDN